MAAGLTWRSWMDRWKANRRVHSHKSIIAYLTANNLLDTANSLRAELNLNEDAFDPATAKRYETLLEKKWTSVVRLQKKAGIQSLRLPSLFACGTHLHFQERKSNL